MNAVDKYYKSDTKTKRWLCEYAAYIIQISVTITGCTIYYWVINI